MLLKVIFLIISINLGFIDAQTANISCNFRQISSDYPYTCELNLNNPNGLDNFDTIHGTHLTGRENEDVLTVSAYGQNSRNIPSIICRQFPNLINFYLTTSNVEIINESAFQGCQNLENVMLSLNRISEVPANTFRNNPNLETILLSGNRINSINADSFTGTSARYLSLGINLLTQYNPDMLASISSTLEILDLVANDLTTLPSRAFSNLPHLNYLDLTGNKFVNLPTNTFTGLNRLEIFYLADCDVSVLNPDWFSEMPLLDVLHLEMNGISELPQETFSSLGRIRMIFLGSNNLTQIALTPFSSVAGHIEVLALDNNPIVGVERALVDRTRHLETLALYNTVCLNDNLYDFNENRIDALERLNRCFLSFGPDLARCNYGVDINQNYACTLTVRNPNANDFVTVEGEHITGRSDNDVVSVLASEQSTLSVPQVLCRQFTQLRNLVIQLSFLDWLNEESFRNCRNLEQLELPYNEITEIGNGTFRNSPQLRELNLANNWIRILNPGTFSGTAIRILDLSYNRIVSINPDWYNAIAQTLETLNLARNNIQIIGSETFVNLRSLRTLNLNDNFIFQIDDNTFSNLPSLQRLSLSGCGLRELNPQWFSALSNLIHLSIGNNHLESFPPGIFNALTSLQELFFYGNRVAELRADSFGASLSTLEMLYGSSNRINVLDPEILEQASELSSLLFYDNLCTDLNIFDVQGDRELVESQLQNCTNNFRVEPSISCEYDRMITGRIYWCQLSMSNPTGRDDFDRIDGQHMPGSNDDAVIYVIAERQSSLVLPSVICRQFESLQNLDLLLNDINEINEETFRECEFLRELMFMGSTIRRIPNRTFQGTPNLQILYLDANRIQTIEQQAFSGTQIKLLDLSYNEISTFDPLTYAAIGSTLRILRLTDNRLEQLPGNAFNALPNLVELELNHNHFFFLPATLFNVPVNLELLQVANCGLEILPPRLFSRLTNLRDLELSLNELDLLPENVFNLPRLETVGLVQNKLRILDSHAFGDALNSILTIDASLNRIVAVDELLISDGSNLRNLNLAYNQCSEGNFGNIPQNIEQVLRALETCINNYNNVSISCEYEEEDAIYECTLTLNNENDRLRFERVEGEHKEQRGDNYVTYLMALGQNSRTIPSVFCQQFRNLEVFYFLASNVETVSSGAFANCENLFSINLSGNKLINLPDGIFQGNPYLSALTLASNMLSLLRPQIFEGTQLYYLDIENNIFSNFDPSWLAPVAENIRYLILRNNNIRRFPDGVFASFPRLVQLEISGNRNSFVHSNAFENLSNMNDLEMANCGLNVLNSHWFKNFEFLNRLEVDMNGITELPNGIFELPHLTTLGIAFNRIRILDSRSFGSSLDSIVILDAEENRIDSIDRRVVENSTALSSLSLAGNLCTDSNFVDVQQEMEKVLENLSGCFESFNNL